MLSKDLAKIQEVRDLIAQAKAAQEKLNHFNQQQIDRAVEAMARAGLQAAENLARLAAGETGMGRVESKTAKNRFSVQEVYEHIRNEKTTGVLRQDSLGYYEIAEPMGIVAAIIPSTNPTSTTLFKALISIKARNCVIFAPHPRASQCIMESAQIMHKAAVQAGIPAGAISCISNPTMEATQELMTHPDISLILATGGPGLVKAAYASGKPAFGVGPGNTPTIIERSADIAHAVRCIVESQLFDYGTVCASEQAVIIDAPIYEDVVRAFKERNAYFLNPEEIAKLSPIAVQNRMMNPKIVGQPAHHIAQMAGIQVPQNTSVLMAPLEGVGDTYPLSHETLAPILAVYRASDWQQACELSLQLLELGGKGHTMGIHSTNPDIIMEIALLNPISRIVTNAPTTQGGIGLATYLAPSMTLGCGTFGNNITSDNITATHLINRKRVATIRRDFALWPDAREIDASICHIEISENNCAAVHEVATSSSASQSFYQVPGQSTSSDGLPQWQISVVKNTPAIAQRGWPYNAIDLENKTSSGQPNSSGNTPSGY